ncbi:MAG: hypothetical protein V2B19_05690 [Pseudomonadota bacterium]
MIQSVTLNGERGRRGVPIFNFNGGDKNGTAQGGKPFLLNLVADPAPGSTTAVAANGIEPSDSFEIKIVYKAHGAAFIGVKAALDKLNHL